MNIYGVPNLNSTAFYCPHCYAFAHMSRRVIASSVHEGPTNFAFTTCSRCNKIACWYINTHNQDLEGNTYYDAILIHPDSYSAEPPSDDMPEDIKKPHGSGKYSPEIASRLCCIVTPRFTEAMQTFGGARKKYQRRHKGAC